MVNKLFDYLEVFSYYYKFQRLLSLLRQPNIQLYDDVIVTTVLAPVLT